MTDQTRAAREVAAGKIDTRVNHTLSTVLDIAQYRAIAIDLQLALDAQTVDLNRAKELLKSAKEWLDDAKLPAAVRGEIAAFLNPESLKGEKNDE